MADQKKNKRQTRTENPVENECVSFGTGAVRSSTEPRYDLIPYIALDRIAKRFTGSIGPEGPTGGAFKYGEGNWEKGLPTSDVINHTIEHILNWSDAFRESLKNNKGDMNQVWYEMRRHSQEDDDLAGAAFGLIVLMYQEANEFFHDDRFTKPT